MAIEVSSPSDLRDRAAELRTRGKVDDLLAAGAIEVSTIDPDRQEVTVYRGGRTDSPTGFAANDMVHSPALAGCGNSLPPQDA